MIYTTLIKDAIKFSIKTHEVYQKQKRKGKDIPYITHPLTVGLILSAAGANEETMNQELCNYSKVLSTTVTVTASWIWVALHIKKLPCRQSQRFKLTNWITANWILPPITIYKLVIRVILPR
ncbi:MAG: HD protein [Candidatus Magasanikbacteria bacterium]|nr:HD protein [Candidatus Magasanikbacteria bacterium]